MKGQAYYFFIILFSNYYSVASNTVLNSEELNLITNSSNTGKKPNLTRSNSSPLLLFLLSQKHKGTEERSDQAWVIDTGFTLMQIRIKQKERRKSIQ